MSFPVFLGPSLSSKIALDILPDATLLPPVRYGDVARMVLTALEEQEATGAPLPKAITIIDGYFHQTAAVWHKEILFALANGIPVLGAASMGALRAAELRVFGMVPVGQIAQAYCEETFAPFAAPFDGDDEVAVQHGPAEIGYPSTLALVDSRARLARGVADGMVSLDQAERALNALKAQYYPDRTEEAFRAVLGEVGVADVTCAALVPVDGMDLKARDARAVLERLAARDVPIVDPVFRFEATQNWTTMLETIASAP